MISAEERRRLMSRLGTGSGTPLGLVLKCAACLLVLVILVGGPWMFQSAGNPTAAQGHGIAGSDAAVADSKRVFDERAGRFQSASPARGAMPAGVASQRD